MKSLTKKALSLAMAIAMAGSCMAFASDVTIGEVVDEGTTTVNIPYTTTETDQLTVIVYEVEDQNDETLPAIDTIGYINQFDAPAIAADATEATGTITFTMKDDFVDAVNGVLADGTYKIIMGGTGVGEADVAYLVVGEEEVTVYGLGDINGSGGTPDVTDLGLLIDHVLKITLIEEGTPGYVAGDINKSGGTPDVTDLGMLIDHVLKITLITE